MRALALLLTFLLASPLLRAEDDYTRSIDEWRAARIASLKKPDGWFSFAGSGLVDTGESRVGRASDNAIVLPKGPDHLGTLKVSEDGRITFRAAEKSEARINAQPIDGEVELETNAGGNTPTRITFGEQWFYVIRSGDTIGWRFRDPESAALESFKGIETFPTDPSWRIEADWEAFDPPREIELVTVINTLEKAKVPGKATFEREGKRYTLQPVTEDDGQLFFIIADKTSGQETYGAARFLYADPPKDGKVVLDFNKAYNPPCALSPHVVCPTAPPENRMALRVTAGEKKFAH
jgi:uncharacterized protein (DUF1684 family)